MQRFALGIEYDGTQHHGWQRQTNAPSIQMDLETALSRVAKEPIRTICAGRTDTGVHALGQIVHFDTPVIRPDKAWVQGTNTFLPPSIRVRFAQQVNFQFNARRRASARRYRYVIFNQSLRSSLLRNHMTWHYRPLDIEPMQEATRFLMGRHDFSSFQGPHCQSLSPIRCIDEIKLKQTGPIICIDIKANAFLHNMVRNIVGMLLAIGDGRKTVNWADEVLQARTRDMGVLCAPPHGLYLAQVYYPEPWTFPVPPEGPFYLWGL